MNYIDAFLWFTALTYFIAVPFPIKFQENWGFITQKLAWAIMGTVWVLCLTGNISYTILNLQIQWLILTIIYVTAALMSYKGVQNWGSTEHNLYMAGWDSLLAIICLTKI